MLQEFVKEYMKINKDVPNINFGGCGVFAEHLYDRLKLMGYKPRLVVLTYPRHVKMLRLRLRLSGQDFVRAYDAAIVHVLVKVDGYYLDNLGAVTSFEDTRYNRYAKFERLSIEKLREINRLPIWNSSFNIRHIPKIIKRLDKIYEKFSSKGLEVSK
jgi:hypothetical protein